MGSIAKTGKRRRVLESEAKRLMWWRRYKCAENDRARNQALFELYESCTELIGKIISSEAAQAIAKLHGYSRDDLYQKAYFGIEKTADRFNPKKGKFGSLAGYLVGEAIKDADDGSARLDAGKDAWAIRCEEEDRDGKLKPLWHRPSLLQDDLREDESSEATWDSDLTHALETRPLAWWQEQIEDWGSDAGGLALLRGLDKLLGAVEAYDPHTIKERIGKPKFHEIRGEAAAAWVMGCARFGTVTDISLPLHVLTFRTSWKDADGRYHPPLSVRSISDLEWKFKEGRTVEFTSKNRKTIARIERDAKAAGPVLTTKTGEWIDALADVVNPPLRKRAE